MSHRADAYARERAKTIARLAKSGHTSKEIARILCIDVNRVPSLRKLGETLLTLEPSAGLGEG